MITKNDWKSFCKYVYIAKQLNMEPYMKDRYISIVDLTNNEILTIKRGEPRIRYIHPGSFTDQSLKYLFSTISFKNVSLDKIMKFSNLYKEATPSTIVATGR